MDVAAFDQALTLLEQKALRSPLTSVQRDYLKIYRTQMVAGAEQVRMMHPLAYVVEVMCDAAAFFTLGNRFFEPPGSLLYRRIACTYQEGLDGNATRFELFSRCLRVLKEFSDTSLPQ